MNIEKARRLTELTRKVRKPIARPRRVMPTKKERDERRRARQRELIEANE